MYSSDKYIILYIYHYAGSDMGHKVCTTAQVMYNIAVAAPVDTGF